MCSLMEKDALIEKVAETMALIARRKEMVQNSEEDSIAMGALTNKIYRSKPDALDFGAIVKQCDTVQAKYRVAV
ncbi:MAG: hypothetical protein IKZ88_02925 [Neisseriaceae bacterium]|nr:hypothetical protein [Neisseriaceae bacterium]